MLIAILALVAFFHLAFLFALYLKDNSIADVAWGMGFIIIDILLFWQSDNYSIEQIIISILVFLWGTRLSAHILLRKIGKQEDFRYQQWRKQWGENIIWRSYLQVFMLQMFLLLIIAIPIFAVYSPAHKMIFEANSVISNLTLAGCAVAFLGLMCEAISDYQMQQFKKTSLNHGKIFTGGLWRYSRHPNYFGEAMFWWGIALLAYSNQNCYLIFISPLLITLLLRYISGVPMLEAKYKNNLEFQRYVGNTSAFIPWFSKK